MKFWMILFSFCLSLALCHADEPKDNADAKKFIRMVVQSLLDDEVKINFRLADKIVALDNGEVISKEDLKKAWPEFAKSALKKRVSTDQFFKDVEMRLGPPSDNKRLMGNKRVLENYKYQDGDIYCDASHVKEGVENFIGYEKVFIYIIRKVEGEWTLLAIGG